LAVLGEALFCLIFTDFALARSPFGAYSCLPIIVLASLFASLLALRCVKATVATVLPIGLDRDFVCNYVVSELKFPFGIFYGAFKRLAGGLPTNCGNCYSLLKFIESRLSRLLSPSLNLIKLSAYSSESSVSFVHFSSSNKFRFTGLAI